VRRPVGFERVVQVAQRLEIRGVVLVGEADRDLQIKMQFLGAVVADAKIPKLIARSQRWLAY